MNELSELTRKLGVDAAYVARKADVQPHLAAAALEPDGPECDAQTYLKCAAALGAKLVLPCGPPLSFWVEAAAVDELLTEPHHRQRWGYCAMPGTKGELRRFVKAKSAELTSYADLARWLDSQWVPKSTGDFGWDFFRARSAAEATGNAGTLNNDDETLTISPAGIERWRRHVMDELLANLVREDALYGVRYGLRWSVGSDKIVVKADVPKMPLVALQWARAGLGRVPWLAGRWGMLP